MHKPGPDVTLRPLAATDASRIAELIGDWQVARWLSSPPHPYALADATVFLTETIGTAIAPARQEVIEVDGVFAGMIGIEPTSRGLNLGYWLGRSYWGRGIMSSAAARLTRDFFANSRETHLMSGYFSGNDTSWAIQRRLGFTFVENGLLMNRPQGKRMAHVLTRLTRAQFQPSLEILQRDTAGAWPSGPETIGVGGTVRLDAIGLELNLSDIYADTHLSAS